MSEVDLLVAAPLQHLGQHLGLLDRSGADQHRLHLGVGVFDLAHDGAHFFFHGPIDLVVLVAALDRQVGRNLDDDQLVDFRELVGLRRGGAGHSGELLVEAEIVLKGNRGERHVLRLNGHPFLRLERLMQPLGIAPPGHHAPGELVDNHDFIVADDVILVALEKLVRPQRLIEVMDQRGVGRFVERSFHHAGRAQELFRVLVAGLGRVDGALLLVEFVFLARETRNEGV